jgi:hypothetical protein
VGAVLEGTRPSFCDPNVNGATIRIDADGRFVVSAQMCILKKLLLVTALLLLVSVQALTASCDLRCSLMGASTDSHALHATMQMPHCHGMSMEQDKQTSVTANDSCGPIGCGTSLKAIAKSAGQNDAGSSKLLVLAAARLVDPFRNSGSNGSTAFASLARTSDTRPLAQRPGSALRI